MLRLFLLASAVVLLPAVSAAGGKDRFAFYGQESPLTVHVQGSASLPFTDYEQAAGIALRRKLPLVVWAGGYVSDDNRPLYAALPDAVHVELPAWPGVRRRAVVVSDKTGREYALTPTALEDQGEARIRLIWSWEDWSPAPVWNAEAVKMATVKKFATYSELSTSDPVDYPPMSGSAVKTRLITISGPIIKTPMKAPTMEVTYGRPTAVGAYLSACEVPARVTYSYSAPPVMYSTGSMMYSSAGPMMYGSAMGAPYGARFMDGTYATATGLPPGPGVLGVPGARFPFDGPLRRMMRRAAGYDPGPATVQGAAVAASAGPT